MQRKFPKLVFGDYAVDALPFESVCAVESPARVILYLHGERSSWVRPPRTETERCAELRCHAEYSFPVIAWRRSTHIPQLWMTHSPHGSPCRPLRRGAPISSRRLGGRGTESQSAPQASRSRFAMPNGSILLFAVDGSDGVGSSVEGNHRKELWFTRSTWRHGRALRPVARTRVPRISHRFSRSFRDLPPALASRRGGRVLLDDGCVSGTAATSAGPTPACSGKGMQHDWPSPCHGSTRAG